MAWGGTAGIQPITTQERIPAVVPAIAAATRSGSRRDPLVTGLDEREKLGGGELSVVAALGDLAHDAGRSEDLESIKGHWCDAPMAARIVAADVIG
ncbi:MAG: hypothetical protein M0T75_04725 [Chloroflexi bacterium]|nr:hypothetical protein [Chloroflexota bacterium]